MRAIEELGYEAPTPIQNATIGLLLGGRDVIGQAQTGTGKTAAYAIPIIERLDGKLVDERGRPRVQALVLAPTRELAVQIAEATHRLGRHRGISIVPIYGGQPIDRQFRALRSGVQIVVGTPGRIMDHMRRGTLDLSTVRFLVLDEADEMLDMGFVEDIEWILQSVPGERQTALFSATVPPRIAALAQKYMRTPERIHISTATSVTVPQIEQTYVEVGRSARLDALCRVIDHQDPESVMIFCRTKRDVDDLGESLLGRGYPAETLHGDLSQAQRDRVMKRFREGHVEILVATDVAARGLDIENVSHVVNYDLPDDPDAYVHRIGRTGRAGRSGIAITFVTPREQRALRTIERVVGTRLKPMRLPTAADIVTRQLDSLKDQARQAIAAGNLESYLTMVAELGEEFDPGEVAAAFARVAAEATQPRSLASVDSKAEEAPTENGMARLSIGIGRRSGIRPADLVGAIANEAGLSGRQIGSIDILTDYSLVEVPASRRDEIIEILRRANFKGEQVRVEVATPGQVAEGLERTRQRGIERGGDQPRGPWMRPRMRDDRRHGGPPDWHARPAPGDAGAFRRGFRRRDDRVEPRRQPRSEGPPKLAD
ncbi:MAG: DEAD/DEAH box helicase [Chloroflexota bacterium]|nr:MAG: DEAD/DEAH box helicase [Chloroflexota bacterium]